MLFLLTAGWKFFNYKVLCEIFFQYPGFISSDCDNKTSDFHQKHVISPRNRTAKKLLRNISDGKEHG